MLIDQNLLLCYAYHAIKSHLSVCCCHIECPVVGGSHVIWKGIPYSSKTYCMALGCRLLSFWFQDLWYERVFPMVMTHIECPVVGGVYTMSYERVYRAELKKWYDSCWNCILAKFRLGLNRIQWIPLRWSQMWKNANQGTKLQIQVIIYWSCKWKTTFMGTCGRIVQRDACGYMAWMWLLFIFSYICASFLEIRMLLEQVGETTAVEVLYVLHALKGRVSGLLYFMKMR